MEDEKIDAQKGLNASVKYIGDIIDMGHILEKTIIQTQHIDEQINILIGINSAIFIYSTTKLDTNSALVFFVLGIASVSSLIVGLIAIHPPEFLRKKNKQNDHQIESLIKNRTIGNFSSSFQYGEALIKTLKEPEKVIQEYAGQIYSISKYYYRPKRDMFKLARNIMLSGMIISAILFLYISFIK